MKKIIITFRCLLLCALFLYPEFSFSKENLYEKAGRYTGKATSYVHEKGTAAYYKGSEYVKQNKGHWVDNTKAGFNKASTVSRDITSKSRNFINENGNKWKEKASEYADKGTKFGKDTYAKTNGYYDQNKENIRLKGEGIYNNTKQATGEFAEGYSKGFVREE